MDVEQLVPAPKVAAQFGVTRRTLGRWIVDPSLDFPVPVGINGRLYFRQREIERHKIECARRSVGARALNSADHAGRAA